MYTPSRAKLIAESITSALGNLKKKKKEDYGLKCFSRQSGETHRLPEFRTELTKYRGEQELPFGEFKPSETYCLVNPKHNSVEGKKNKQRIERIIDTFLNKVAKSAPSPAHQYFAKQGELTPSALAASKLLPSSSAGANFSASPTSTKLKNVAGKTTGKKEQKSTGTAKKAVAKSAVKKTITKSTATKKAKKDRPSPSESATSVKEGTKKKGNDGNMWVVKKNSAGVQRWVKL
jgi:hypothetical protein